MASPGGAGTRARRLDTHVETNEQQWIIKALQLNQDQFEGPYDFE
jgi:hypothetical protein